MPEYANPMDAAAAQAMKEFHQMCEQATKAELDGIQKVIDFQKDWKSTAGYRKIWRQLILLKVNG